MTTPISWTGLPLFDAHLHILDPRFPLVPNRGYLPPVFTADDYRRAVAGLGVSGGAVVSGSFQGYDRSYLTDALSRLGPGFVGVAQLPAEVPDAEILDLDRLGVRAVRFNLHRGMASDHRSALRLAERVHDLAGWHAELYLDAALLPDLEPLLARLPRICIDHLGLSRRGLPHLLKWVARGAWVKASGFGRLDQDPAQALAAIHREAPHSLVFGSDLPGTRAPRPFELGDLDLLASALGEPQAVRRVLYDNAVALYRPRG